MVSRCSFEWDHGPDLGFGHQSKTDTSEVATFSPFHRNVSPTRSTKWKYPAQRFFTRFGLDLPGDFMLASVESKSEELLKVEAAQ